MLFLSLLVRSAATIVIVAAIVIVGYGLREAMKADI